MTTNEFTFIEINNFEKYFIPLRERKVGNDNNSLILKKILDLKVSNCNSLFSINDFERYLYYPKAFEKKIETFKTYIASTKYIFLHSYAKNGKSTFIEMYRKNCLDKVLIFDFSNSKPDIVEKLLEIKVKEYFTSFILDDIDNNKGLIKFLAQFDVCYKKNKDEINNNDVKKIGKLISDLNSLIIEKQLIEGAIIKNISKFEIEIFSNFDIDFLFSLLIAVVFRNEIVKKPNTEKIFVFENLDDVYTYLPEEINTIYAARISAFLEKLSIICPEFFIPPFKTNNIHPVFVFVYRSSNFLSAVNYISQESESTLSRIDLFNQSNCKKLQITSVKDSIHIIKKRLQFYFDLCKVFSIAPSNKAEVLNNISNVLLHEEKQKSSFIPITVLRLWNGNKNSFYEFMLNSEFSDKDIIAIMNPEVNKRVKLGIIYNYFLVYYSKISNTTQNQGLRRFLLFIFSSFDNDIKSKKCNIARLFFTYIYNQKLNNGSIRTINHVFSKGILLSDFLRDIKKIKRGNIPVYLEEEIESLFLNLFNAEVDSWGNFFCCCTDTKRINESSKSEYKWIADLKLALKFNDISNKIKIFANDSANYFMFNFRRNFEYFSFCSLKKDEDSISQSLVSLLGFEIVNDTVNFLFLPILENVYQRVEIVATSTLNFYKEVFSNYYKAEEYCNCNWSYNKKFYFDDLISNIIGYLEDVRYDIMRNKLKAYGQFSDNHSYESIICSINKIFIFYISKYISLFMKLYDSISEFEGSNFRCESLQRTKSSFIEMSEIIKLIENDFSNSELKVISKKDIN